MFQFGNVHLWLLYGFLSIELGHGIDESICLCSIFAFLRIWTFTTNVRITWCDNLYKRYDHKHNFCTRKHSRQIHLIMICVNSFSGVVVVLTRLSRFVEWQLKKKKKALNKKKRIIQSTIGVAKTCANKASSSPSIVKWAFQELLLKHQQKQLNKWKWTNGKFYKQITKQPFVSNHFIVLIYVGKQVGKRIKDVAFAIVLSPAISFQYTLKTTSFEKIIV